MKVDGARSITLQLTYKSTVRLGGEWMPSEWELIEKAKSGDRDALSEIVADCWHPLHRFISYKTGNPEDAQDLVQETFYRAFRSLSTYQKTETRFSTYLGRIAMNLITDLWRKKGRSPVTQEVNEHSNHISGGENPVETLVNNEEREMLAALVQALPDEQCRVIELRVIAGIPVKDAAKVMGKSEAAIKMLQQRALKNLREMLRNRGVFESR